MKQNKNVRLEKQLSKRKDSDRNWQRLRNGVKKRLWWFALY
jgi:hypothetical protein